jgi:hypothetical protein
MDAGNSSEKRTLIPDLQNENLKSLLQEENFLNLLLKIFDTLGMKVQILTMALNHLATSSISSATSLLSTTILLPPSTTGC